MQSLSGLYAITPEGLDTPRLLHAAEQALAGGARILQYRDKSSNATLRLEQASHLAALCRQHRATFIINDDLALAKAVRADGVHLGKDDQHLADARAELGAVTLIGISCYNDLSLGRAAARQGADYLAFGTFFPSGTKPLAVRAQPSLITQAKAEFGLPVVAIGGITPDNAAPLVAAGADMLAVIQSIFNQADILSAAARFRVFFPTL